MRSMLVNDFEAAGCTHDALSWTYTSTHFYPTTVTLLFLY